MKKLIVLFALAAALLVPILAVNSASAVNINDKLCQQAKTKAAGNGTPAICSDDDADGGTNPILGPSGIVTKLTRIFSIVLGIAAVIVIIMSGFRFVTSTGDPGGVSTAKKTLLYAIVGLLVAASAQIIVSTVLVKL